MAKKSMHDGAYLGVTAEDLLSFERDVLPKALQGDYDAFTSVCIVCSKALKQGHVLPAGLLAFVSNGLGAMADGVDLNEAWNVRRKRGQKDTILPLWNASNLALLAESARDEGLTLEKAFVEVAERECVSPETVRRAWRLHHHKVQRSEGRVTGIAIEPANTQIK